jgi:hypothetical protein
MANYIFTLQQRLFGNLYDNRYYIQAADDGAATSICDAIVTGHAAIQSGDVEYLAGLVTLNEGDHHSFAYTPVSTNGGQTGGQTLPGQVFLEFVFFATTGKKKVTHRIRGVFANSVTELGVFSVLSTGIGDYDGSSAITTSPAFTGYASYLDAIASNSFSPDYVTLTGSPRVSVGSKRAGRAL